MSTSTPMFLVEVEDDHFFRSGQSAEPPFVIWALPARQSDTLHRSIVCSRCQEGDKKKKMETRSPFKPVPLNEENTWACALVVTRKPSVFGTRISAWVSSIHLRRENSRRIDNSPAKAKSTRQFLRKTIHLLFNTINLSLFKDLYIRYNLLLFLKCH